MKDEELWQAIYAYNRQVKLDREKGKKLDLVRELTETLSGSPDLRALLQFLQELKQVLK